MKYRVNIISGPDAGRCFKLSEREMLLVGRGEDCGIRLADPSVSRVGQPTRRIDPPSLLVICKPSQNSSKQRFALSEPGDALLPPQTA